jgi:tetratricopeptide (TPR) repeat protein
MLRPTSFTCEADTTRSNGRYQETQRAISYFQQAIAIDPSYALAYVGLADAHVSALAANLPSNEFFPQARAAAQKAIEIDDTLAAAHAQLGFITFWYDWDWGGSEKMLKRALELDPDGADTRLFYAHLLSNTGRHAEALAEAKRARELDPINLRINALEAQFLIHAGRTDDALTRLQETLEMDSNYYLAHLYASSAYIEKGMYSEAISEARRAREISGARSTYSEAFLGYALAKSGKEAEARSVLDGLLKSSAEHNVSSYEIALIHNGLGHHDDALAWLERAYAQRSPAIVFLKVEPKWNNLRSDPRFQDLLRRVGLSE